MPKKPVFSDTDCRRCGLLQQLRTEERVNFYKHFIGDYQRDTGHLSLMEHGAYRLMLDTFYATQKPLPKDRRSLYRLLRAEGTAERKAIDSVVAQFWTAGEKGLVNLRAETEIVKAQKQAEGNRQIAHAREEKRRMAKRIADAGCGADQLFSGVSESNHGALAGPENQVYGVSRADGSSMPDEKQAINGASDVKGTNKDAFMAIRKGKTCKASAIQADVVGDLAGSGEKKRYVWCRMSGKTQAGNGSSRDQGSGCQGGSVWAGKKGR